MLERVPPEVLSRIFVHCLPDNLFSVVRDEPPCFPNKAFLHICELNSYTRAVAIGTPKLWTFIRIVIPACRPENSPYQVVGRWLERSGVLPLHLELYQIRMWSQDYKSTSLSYTRQIFEAFSKALWHCRYLKMQVASRTLSGPLLIPEEYVRKGGPPRSERSHMLEDLRINYTDEPFHPNDAFSTGTLIFSLTAPHLRRISGSFLRDIQTWQNWQSSLPWMQIVELDLRLFDVSTSIEILSLCPNLVRYRLDVDSGGRLAFGLFPTKPLEHKSLQSLDILGPTYDLSPLMLRLTLPSLKELRLEKLTWRFSTTLPNNWPHEEFLGMLERSKCAIALLRLHNLEANAEELEQIVRLPVLQRVEQFSVGEVYGWNFSALLKENLMRWLTVEEDEDGSTGVEEETKVAVMPNLIHLTVDGNSINDSCSDGLISAMMQSRWRDDTDAEPGKERRVKVARLEELKIDVPADHSQDRAILTQLVEKGLKFEFTA